MKLKYMKKVLAMSLTAVMLTGTISSTPVFAEEPTQSTETGTTVEPAQEAEEKTETVLQEKEEDAETDFAESVKTEEAVLESHGAETEVESEDTETVLEGIEGETTLEETKVKENEPEETESEVKSSAKGENYDITAPVINAIVIDKQGGTVTAGDTVTISVDAYDTGVGVESVSAHVSHLIGTNSTSSKFCDLKYNDETGKYEGEITIWNSDKTGKYFINSLTVKDMNGNKAEAVVSSRGVSYASESDALYWYYVKNGDDTKAPDVQKVSLTKNGIELNEDDIIEPGNTVHISVLATDDVELAYSANVSLIYDRTANSSYNYDASTNAHKYLSLIYNADTQTYEGDFEITNNLHPGVWKVSYVSVRDVAGNEKNLYSYNSSDAVIKNLTFTLKNDNFDVVYPVVKNVSIDKNGEVVSAGDSVKITVEATDNEGVDTVGVMLNPVASGINSKYIILTRNEETGVYEGIFEITDSTYPCEWYISYVTVIDISGNGLSVYNLTDDAEKPRLEEECYINVVNGDTFVNPTCIVVFNYLTENDEMTTKTIEVPRRTTWDEVEKMFAPTHSKLEFSEWSHNISGFLGVNCILQGGNLTARYDKAIVEFWLDIPTSTGDWDSILIKKEYAERGASVEVPRKIEGYKNIVWYEPYTYQQEIITGDTITVSDTAGIFVAYWGEAEVDTDSPVAPTEPTIPDTPITPDVPDTPVIPNTLPEQQIAETVSEITEAESGEVVKIPMNNATVVPKEILEAAQGKDIDVVLEMDGYTWTINGTEILDKNLEDINLEVTRNTDYIPSGIVSQLAGSNPVEQISLTHNGNFGFTASLTLNVGSQYAGQDGNLYYYDSDGKMVFMNAGAIDAEGNVSLSFSHASEYAIVITPKENMGAQTDNNQGNVQNTGVTTSDNAAQPVTAPKTGDTTSETVVYVMFLILLFALGVMVYYLDEVAKVIRKRMRK